MVSDNTSTEETLAYEVIKKKDESVSMVSRVELIKHCPVCI